mmetsp:Transcript_10196/g.15360  ORF Transcript_10196/g.15360 Transcript_10196/m.15360 type:complete len:172 (+) Transcript_10196:54-569(+)
MSSETYSFLEELDKFEQHPVVKGFLIFSIIGGCVWLIIHYIQNKRHRAALEAAHQRLLEQEESIPTIESQDMHRSQLSEFDGSDPKKPILIGASGIIFNVTQSKGFYGPGGPYNCFAGRDATRGLATMSTNAEEFANNHSTKGLSKSELETLQQWVSKFESKYPIVGKILD